jgi:hypothetical protein
MGTNGFKYVKFDMQIDISIEVDLLLHFYHLSDK